MEQEVAKPAWEAQASDILPLLASCAWHQRHAPRLIAGHRALGGAFWLLGQRHTVQRAPLGTVGIIATWNYPVQLLGVQLLQALVCGNRVAVKPSEHAPRTQSLLLDLAEQAGLPAGTIERFPATREAGAAMLSRGGLDHVLFTGSTEVGATVARWAANTLTPTTLELSGRDSALVLHDADPALAARCIWTAVELNGGQTCMAPRRALILDGAWDRFVHALRPLAAGAAPRTLMTESAAHRCADLAADAISRGARSASGVVEPNRGRSLRPIALIDCPADAQAVRGDHFGPVLAVVRCASLDEALAVHRSNGPHLSASVFARDARAARSLAPSLGASAVTINDTLTPTAHPGACIAGRGTSGWGASRGVEGLLALSRPVAVSTTHPLVRIPPGTPPLWVQSKGLDSLVRMYGGAAAGGTRARSNALGGGEPQPQPRTGAAGSIRVSGQTT